MSTKRGGGKGPSPPLCPFLLAERLMLLGAQLFLLTAGKTGPVAATEKQWFDYHVAVDQLIDWMLSQPVSIKTIIKKPINFL